MTEIEIGLGKSARRAYRLDEVVIVPSRRTRDPGDVDISWQIDAYRFDIPMLGAFADSVTSPETAIQIGQLGGVAVLDLEGVWTRHENPAPALAELALLPAADAARRLRDLYSQPVRPELVTARIAEIAASGVYTAGRVRPPMAARLAPHAVAAEIDLLVIAGMVVSAEHVASSSLPLNLKTFIRGMQTPVIVGGCMSYRAALHLMRTGAAGVIVGVGAGYASTSHRVLGVEAPLATAISDARAARMRHLDETGVYCHVIAAGTMRTAGDVAKAVVCGADAVMLGLPLASASDSPCPGRHWSISAGHATLPRSRVMEITQNGTLAEIVHGPARSPDGTTNLMDCLKASMAKCGYTDVKDFQRAQAAVIAC